MVLIKSGILGLHAWLKTLPLRTNF